MGLGRALGLIGTVVTLAVGMYIYSLQVKTLQPSSAGAPSEETATITGVKLDLIGIANAERGYMATQGKYASMDDLISGGYLTTRRERPPYIYDLTITPGGFSATATRTTKGSPAQMWVTETMEVQSSE
ncbi:MAG: hypothetical protein WCF22_12550 [Candidatus Sulfotelmatobacter sp.]